MQLIPSASQPRLAATRDASRNGRRWIRIAPSIGMSSQFWSGTARTQARVIASSVAGDESRVRRITLPTAGEPIDVGR
jgi:hypothetical protein